MTKRIFRSIVAVALTVLVAALVLVMGAMYSYSTEIQFAQLRVETALAAHAVDNEGLRYFDKLEGTMDCRITWIGADGTVLYDNRSSLDEMENHLEREEVIDALESGYGQSSRYSSTLMEQYIYAAERLPDGTVLRLSSARSSVLTLVFDMLQPIVVILAAAVLLSLVLANRLSRHIVQPLNRLNLDSPLSNKKYPEIAPLLHRIHSQQAQLRSQSDELSRRQRQFDTVTASMNEGLVLLDNTVTVLSINPAAARQLGAPGNCVGTDFLMINRTPQVCELIYSALNGEKAEKNVRLNSGTYQLHTSPVRTDGIISGVVLLIFDITEKQKAEMLRREFTANVSHELKTPLHSISGYAELMKSGLVPPQDTADFSEKIYNEAQRLIRLVEDILRLSRLDEGAEDMQWAQLDLYCAAQSTLENLRAAAELSGVTLTLEGKSTVVRGIPQLLSGILFNLTDNAIKYNRPGGQVTVTVADAQDAVRLTVADTGIGIPEAARDRIFERFYRVDKSHSKEVGGTGLGLSIVKHAAMILGAKICLESEEGKGTTITVVFPK